MTKVQAVIFAISPQEERTTAAEKTGKKKSSQIGFGSHRSKAQTRSAAAVLRQRSAAQEESSHAALLDVAHAFTPRVENTRSDRLLLDLDGLERLYGPPSAMASELASRVSTLGLDANLGLAAIPDAAMHAACGFAGVTVIPAGEEARRLGVLPIHVLLDCFEITGRNAPENSAATREREKQREQMLDTLERWGVRDFRTLSLLPEHALAARLGEAGARMQRLVRGDSMRILTLCEPSAQFEEAMELESPVETLEPLSFLLNRLLDQLCARLEARALAVQELKLRLQLEPRVGNEQEITLEELTVGAKNLESVILSEAIPRSGRAESKSRRFAGVAGSRDPEQGRRGDRVEGDPYPAFKDSSSTPQSRNDGGASIGRGASPCTDSPSHLQAAERPTPSAQNNLYTRILRLPVAMRDPKVFLKLLQLDLSAHPPGAPVCKLWITAEPARPRSAQSGLFLPVTPEAEKLEITLARINGVVGERRAGIAKLLDTHRHGAFQMEHFVPKEDPNRNHIPTLPDIPQVALRIFRPARQVRVQMTDERPCRLMLASQNGDQDVLQGQILWSAGPWRSSGDWWTQYSCAHGSNEDVGVWDREEWDIALAQKKSGDVVLYRVYRDIATNNWFIDASYD